MGKDIKGVLGTKLGMTQVFGDDGKIVPVTVVEAGPCVVTAVRTPGADGYAPCSSATARSTRGGSPSRWPATSPRPGVTPRRYLVELRTDDADQYTLGQEVTAETFDAGQLVNVTGKSKGKGTAGVMKRHGFKGLGASHGTQRKHRSPGSIGGCATPGRVFKGLRMAGRMGNEPDHGAAADRPRGGRRPWPAAHQGRGSRARGQPGPGPQRGQAASGDERGAAR